MLRFLRDRRQASGPAVNTIFCVGAFSISTIFFSLTKKNSKMFTFLRNPVAILVNFPLAETLYVTL